ncbi:MAG: GNAT family N-acetyltransferase [Gemella sp.]|nr:GNAT family N-acetyltransferase [Gemella sp.]
MKLKIKHYNELSTDELFAIFYARSEVFVVEQKITEEVDMDNNDKDCYHIWFEEDGKVLSYLRVIAREEDYAYIGRVASVVKRQGLASKLLQEAKEFIRVKLKKDYIKLSAQSYVISLYEKAGFEVVSEEYLDVNIPHVDMILNLK